MQRNSKLHLKPKGIVGVTKAHLVWYFQDFTSYYFKFTSVALGNFTLSHPHSVFALDRPEGPLLKIKLLVSDTVLFSTKVYCLQAKSKGPGKRNFLIFNSYANAFSTIII